MGGGGVNVVADAVPGKSARTRWYGMEPLKTAAGVGGGGGEWG